MAGTIAPFPKHQFFDNSGLPAVGYKLFTYTSGTTVKATTYTDQACSASNANPIILDSAGRCSIFLPIGQSWKFVMALPTDTDPPGAPIWTIDNVNSVPATSINLDVTGTAGEVLTAGNCVYLSAGSGGKTAGQWYNADADFDYASMTASMVGFALATITSSSTGSIRIQGQVTGLAGLAAGSLYYASQTAGQIVTPAPAIPRVVGMADSATTLLMASWLPQNAASTTVPGIATTGTQSFAGAKTFASAAAFASSVAITGDTTVGGTLGVTGAATVGGTLATTGKITTSGGIQSSTAPTYVAGTNATTQLCYVQITVAPGGIPASATAFTSVAGNLTGITGLLVSDYLVGIQKAATQDGLFITPLDGSLTGGITGAGTATVKYFNCTGGAIVPTAGETYTFTILRYCTVGTPQLTPVRISAIPTGIPAQITTATTNNVALTGITGLLSTDILIGVTKPATQTGLFILSTDLAQGGVTGAGAATVRFVNVTTGTLNPTASESYTFTVLRTAVLGTQTLTPIRWWSGYSLGGVSCGAKTTIQNPVTGLPRTAGLLLQSSDVLVGVTSATNIAGAFTMPSDLAQGGVISTTAITFKEVNVTVGALTPDPYVLYLLRLTSLAMPLVTTSGLISSQLSYAGVGNVATTETNLFAYIVPGNTLSAAGQSLRCTAWGEIATNANTKTLRFYFQSGPWFSLVFTASVAHSWWVMIEICCIAYNQQTAWLRGASALPALSSAAGSNYVSTAVGTENLTYDANCYITGQSSSAGGTNDILCHGLKIEVVGCGA